jgi:PRC-barrel domain
LIWFRDTQIFLQMFSGKKPPLLVLHSAIQPEQGNHPPAQAFLLHAPLMCAELLILEKIMKKLMLGTAVAALIGTSVSAQDLFRAEMDPVAITASDFIGKRVYAAEAVIDADEYAGVQDGWNDIGEINDVILTRDGKVDAVLVDIGGFLGMGERQVALGMENIRFVADGATADDLNDFFLVINADRATLEGAPDFMRTGAMPADMAEPAATATANTDVATTDATTGTDAVMATEGKVVEGYTAIDLAGMEQDKLIGVRVYGPNGEDVGEISEVLMDANGAAGQVIVDVGGFLGMGEKPVALDLVSLNILQENDGTMLRAYSSMTQEQLETLPVVAK